MMAKEDVLVSQSMRRLTLRARTTVVLMVPALCFTASGLGQENKPPQYQVDAPWPKPFPNNWLIWSGRRRRQA